MSYQENQIKTYYPTLEQMKDFSAYMRYIHEDGGHKAGLAKIVPPCGYKPRRAGYSDESLYNMEITCPIKQEVSGEGGLYQQLNLVEKKKMLVRNFKKLAETKYPTPVVDSNSELERAFWKNIFTNPSIYGADVPGTLYDESCDEFNLTRLNTILDDIEGDYGVTIQGVNTTYLYFGMWKSSFCWHTEDMDLYSINYLHTGQPKAWYCIAPEYGKRFERLAASFFPHSFRTCKAFLRHKTTLISPQILKKYSIPFSRCTQQAGEFMITFPYSYHSGFNHGFNIAEATNFALEYWIDFGKWATRCECSSESVKISMQTFVKRYQADRYENWLKGKDVCKDPRDPKHVAAAPKPNEYDLYLMGSHEREALEEADLEETKRKIALQQNQSSNVRSKSKKAKKTLLNLQDYWAAHSLDELGHEAEANSKSYPTFPSIAPSIDDVPKDLTMSKNTPACAPKSEKAISRQLKRSKEKEDRMRMKREKRAQERIVSSNQLMHFLPLTFTHEKRFNRCIAAQPPHCSVCQLFATHPNEDESIWGPREQSERTKQITDPQQLGIESQADSVDTSSVSIPQSTTAGSKVEDFTLPESSRVWLPRGLFIRDPANTWCDFYGPRPTSEPDSRDKVHPIKQEAEPVSTSEVVANTSQNSILEQQENSEEHKEHLDEHKNAPTEQKNEQQDQSTVEERQEEPSDLRENDSGYGEFLDLHLESSELLQCTICMLTVHTLCYGLDTTPENKKDWICDRCKESNRSLINCALCPCRGGALKAVSDTWVHITCFLTTSDLNFMDLIKPDASAPSKLKLPDTTGDRNTCIYCAKNLNLSKYVQGKCIGCIGHWGLDGAEIECPNTFHSTCGHRNGAKFDCFDLHNDPMQKCPIRAACGDCRATSDMMFRESNEFEADIITGKDDLCTIPTGTQVIAKTPEGTYRTGYIENYNVYDLFDVFFPMKSELELNVNSTRIVDFNGEREYKIGDLLKVRGFKERTRQGKFKARRRVQEYLVRFNGSSSGDKVARKDIYLGVDQMSKEQCELFLREIETPAVLKMED